MVQKEKEVDFVEEVVTQVAGPDVVRLVRILRNKENVSEFTLANQMKLEINKTRNMLYRLYESSLVTFTRKKDKKKGWYIYFWTFNEPRTFDLMKELRQQKTERLKERLIREQSNQFYLCENKCIRLDFDKAAELEFKCPECEKLLDLFDNKTQIIDIQNQIVELLKPFVMPKKKYKAPKTADEKAEIKKGKTIARKAKAAAKKKSKKPAKTAKKKPAKKSKPKKKK